MPNCADKVFKITTAIDILVAQSQQSLLCVALQAFVIFFGDSVPIIKIVAVATRCQILRLECTKFDFGWGSAPDPAEGAYSAPPDP